MATEQNLDGPILQLFQDEKYNEMGKLPTHVDPDTNVRYVLLSDMQRSFADVRLFESRCSGRRVFFMVNKYYQV